MGLFDAFKRKSTENILQLATIISETFQDFSDNCISVDRTELDFCFTYVLNTHQGGRDMIHVYRNTTLKTYFLQRLITETRPIGSPHSGMVDEITKDIAGFRPISHRTVVEMAIDRYEWLKACNYTNNREYETESNTCRQILKDINDLSSYTEIIEKAEKRYAWLKKYH